MRVLACLTIVFAVFSISRAENELQNLTVTRETDQINIRITTSEPCVFEHFMLKESPERIVIDLKNTRNGWSKKIFDNLPFESIEKIRTSQYQVSPELITRIVLDINRPIDYTVEEQPSGLQINIPVVANEGVFMPWNVNQPPAPAPIKVQKIKVVADEPAQVEKTAAQKRLSSVKIETFPKRKVVTYKPGSARDPFRSLIGSSGGIVATGEIPAVENLTLVGVFDDETGMKALFEDTEGRGFILAPNDRVQNGYLVSIREDKAIFQVTEYGWTRTVALNLEEPGSE
jgi:hypothetical protein